MFPLNTKQFSVAFLDVKRNSQGYNEEVSSVDRDATKKLLRPFHIPQIGPSSIPQCHHLGTMMWNFMWNCARRECYPPAHHLESREDSRMESRRAPEQSCSSVLPEFELHRATSKHKAREANERQSAENIELSRLVKTQSLNKTSSTRSTDSSRNNVMCDWWLNSENISNLNESTAPLIPCACSVEKGDFVGKKKFLERLLETELQIKPLTG